MPNSAMTVRIWGARGSIPCPGPSTLRYGGNTSCVEIMCGQHRLVFDAGSGLRMLGLHLAQQKAKADIDLKPNASLVHPRHDDDPNSAVVLVVADRPHFEGGRVEGDSVVDDLLSKDVGEGRP